MSLTVETETIAASRTTFAPVDAERRADSRQRLDAEFVPAEGWDGVASQFDDVVQEQLYAYARTCWPSAKPEALVFSRDGEMVGGTLVMLQRLPLRLGTIAISKWGPMLKHGQGPDAAAIYAGMVDALVEEYAVRRRMLLSVLPRAATAAGNWRYEHLLARRFRAGAVQHFPDRYLVDLRRSDAEQRKSLLQKWRYHLGKAEKAGLSFERAGVERAGEFDALYVAMTDRKKFPDHSAYQTIPALFVIDQPALRPELFFVRHEGEVVAGAIVFKAGDTAVYLFGATNDRALPLRAGYFLHWHIIQWLRDNTAAKWYDLGGTNGFQGLHQFKKGLVGDAGLITPVPPVANYAAYRWPRLVGSAAFGARDLAQRLERRLEGVRTGLAKPTQAGAAGPGE